MPWTIERLRVAIVALAVLLLLAIAGSFFYGRWRLGHIAQDLPARLGIQIQQSTQGFVLSKTEQGQPLFTLHAARAVEFKSGGHVSLHDVEIDLYNRQTGVADTIAGNDFEYDPRSQVVQSNGEAHIVLHAPAKDGGAGATSKNEGQTIRVTTHGLTFNQKTGVATCSGEVDFQVADSSGQAVGAEYDSKQGHLLLKSDVVLKTTMQNQPAVLHASRAMYDRGEGQVHLWQPRYTSATQRGTAETATVLLRTNGYPERVNAQGEVQLASNNGMRIEAPAMQVSLNERSQPRQAQFSGGVRFGEDEPAQKISGNAREAEVGFDLSGRANHAVLDGAVQFHQQTSAGANNLQRTLAANHLILNLMPSKTGNVQLRSADASGNAVFTSLSIVPEHAPQQAVLAGQTLNAKFAAGNQLQQIDGAGQTSLKTVAANGDVDSSTGDTLQIEFTSGQNTSTTGQRNAMAAQSIRTAVQTGHVVLQQIGKEKKSGSQISTATAERASYLAANDTLTLTGNPVFRDAQLEMTARRMELERATGKMISKGAVQATLLSNNMQMNAGGLLDGKQPVHIIAEQATVIHDTETAVFSRRARLWQGGDTVEASVIELSQKTQTLKAYGDSACTQCVISNFLGTSTSSAQPSKREQAAPSTFRVISERLLYSDAERKASFLHHVQVVSSSGMLFSDDAEIFLTPVSTAKKKNLSSSRNNGEQSSVERIVATGNVKLLQQGRSATGTRLVYTAADGHFVLTGDEAAPPKVIDLDRGTVTGQVLTFASREQAIMVSGTPGHTTTTNTRVQKK